MAADTQAMPNSEEKSKPKTPTTLLPAPVQTAKPSAASAVQVIDTSEQPTASLVAKEKQEASGDSNTVSPTNMAELTLAERKKLRHIRFKTGGSMDVSTTNTMDALGLLREQKEKMKARAKRFGVLTEEMNEDRIKERQKRFGIETNESMKEKFEKRKQRFAAMDD